MMNIVEDVLSWGPHIFLVISLQTNIRERILTIQFDDDWYRDVKEIIGQDTMMIPMFEIYTLGNDGLMRYNNQIYVLPNDKLRNLILNEAHRAVYMAHLGVMKMRVDLNPLFFWKE
jgi:hypothetical protein